MICSFSLNACFSKVPPPRNFSRPAGGARSVAIHMEPVANLRRPSVENAESSYLMGKRNVEGERSERKDSGEDGMNFSRQVSGWGSAATHVEPVARNRSQSVASFASSEPFEPTKPHSHHRGKTSQKYRKPIFGEGAEETRSSTRPSHVIHRQSTLHGFSTMRAAELVCFIYINNLAQEVTLCC